MARDGMADAAFAEGPIQGDEVGHASRWETMRFCAEELDALLSAPVGSGWTVPSTTNSAAGNQWGSAPVGSPPQEQVSATPEPDWRRFCVNHNGYSGNTAYCPTCSPANTRREDA
jgi:hypothetical protein